MATTPEPVIAEGAVRVDRALLVHAAELPAGD